MTTEIDWAQVLQTSPLAMWIVTEGRILAVNEAALALFGAGNESEFALRVAAADSLARVVSWPVAETGARVFQAVETRRQQLDSAERAVLEALASSNAPTQDVLDSISRLAVFSAGGGSQAMIFEALDSRQDAFRLVSAPASPELVGQRFADPQVGPGLHAFPVCGQEGQVLGMLAVAMSSTPAPEALETSVSLAAIALTRRSHLRRLRNKQERLAAISRAAPVGLYQVDSEGVWIFANERLFQMTGLPLDRCHGEGWLESVHPDDREAVRDAWRSAVSTGTGFQYEYRLAAAGGADPLWVSAYESIAGGEGGRLGTITDVTRLKQSAAELSEVADRFQTLANNISQFCWMADAEGSLFWYNDRWYEYTGTTFEQVRGWGWRRVHHPDHVERVAEGFARSCATGEVWEDTFPLRGSNGGYRWFLSRALPIRDASGRVTRWFGTNTDITEQRHLEAALHHQNLALQRSNEDLSRFAFIASHDLQEPLRLISTFAQLVVRSTEGALAAKPAGYMESIIAAAARMHRLIQDLLVYAQASSDGDRKAGVVNLATLVPIVVEDLRAQAEEAGAVLHIAGLPEVWGIEAQINQVLQNLLSNSIKYRRQGVPPEIHINAVKEGAYWRISVRDNGQGFEPEYAARIFDFLKRLHGRDVPGSGIGLAICKTIVQRNGGAIGAEGKPGEGSLFWFTLPAIEP